MTTTQMLMDKVSEMYRQFYMGIKSQAATVGNDMPKIQKTWVNISHPRPEVHPEYRIIDESISGVLRFEIIGSNFVNVDIPIFVIDDWVDGKYQVSPNGTIPARVGTEDHHFADMAELVNEAWAEFSGKKQFPRPIGYQWGPIIQLPKKVVDRPYI